MTYSKRLCRIAASERGRGGKERGREVERERAVARLIAHLLGTRRLTHGARLSAALAAAMKRLRWVEEKQRGRVGVKGKRGHSRGHGEREGEGARGQAAADRRSLPLSLSPAVLRRLQLNHTHTHAHTHTHKRTPLPTGQSSRDCRRGVHFGVASHPNTMAAPEDFELRRPSTAEVDACRIDRWYPQLTGKTIAT